MPNIEIVCDGTTKGLQIIVDGVDITKEKSITMVEFSASAWDEYISYRYTVSEPYINEAGEEQGRINVSYSYHNNKWMKEEKREEPRLGETEDSDKKLGGKTLKDLSRQDKMKRLFFKD